MKKNIGGNSSIKKNIISKQENFLYKVTITSWVSYQDTLLRWKDGEEYGWGEAFYFAVLLSLLSRYHSSTVASSRTVAVCSSFVNK